MSRLLQTLNRLSNNPLPPNRSSPPPASTPKLEPGTNLQPGTKLQPGPNLVPGTDLFKRIRSPNGRWLTIQKATRVEHAHTTAEQTLLKAMFKLGTQETSTSRLLKISVRGLAAHVGCHKNRCRDHLRSLAEKFAIEEAETFNSLAGKLDGARVWRIFDFDTILKRRDEAGLTHVVRTGSVYFVDPGTGDRLQPGTNLQPGPRLVAEPGTNLVPGPGTNLVPLSTKNLIKEIEEVTTTTTTDPGTNLQPGTDLQPGPDPAPLQTAIDTLALKARVKKWRRIDTQAGLKIEAVRLEHGASVEEAAWLFVHGWKTMEDSLGNPIGAFLKDPALWITPAILNDFREAGGGL